eukprot:CAMPEP_0181209156 /NCGR_PEP_ID=MMETSP1096-20121128/22511_1 /TAXON_ID=156174 ORGANISM="Chrysochromulina ericina, Strain CCMP281" /NCGR_SAMPLE_ID=MMETSP1096 /ASSEMBLY_ACC=CAM_ASM_000453 /LENGTH=231 /DNA_ID=CAMNT_0023300289 /DNA_START=228 /DNA_END=920 /DNA_ORIENTATION=+
MKTAAFGLHACILAQPRMQEPTAPTPVHLLAARHGKADEGARLRRQVLVVEPLRSQYAAAARVRIVKEAGRPRDEKNLGGLEHEGADDKREEPRHQDQVSRIRLAELETIHEDGEHGDDCEHQDDTPRRPLPAPVLSRGAPPQILFERLVQLDEAHELGLKAVTSLTWPTSAERAWWPRTAAWTLSAAVNRFDRHARAARERSLACRRVAASCCVVSLSRSSSLYDVAAAG